MNLLPDILDGQIKDNLDVSVPKLYTPPRTTNLKAEEARLSELNNLGRQKVAEDFSDSPHL